MPFGFDINVDMKKNQLLNVLLQILAADPGSPTEANVYYNNVDHTLHFYNGTAWITVGRLDQMTAPTGSVPLNNQKITGLGAPTVATDAATRGYVDGQTLNGLATRTASTADITASGFKITNLGTPTAGTDASTKAYVDGQTLNGIATRTPATADVDINTHKLLNVTDPTNAQDAATKAYVDAVTAGLNWKDSVRVVATTQGTLATAYANAQTVDSVVLATGNRILLAGQTAGQENGIYVVQAAGAPVRATDADLGTEIVSAAVFVEEGTVNADTQWIMSTNAPITINTTPLVWTQFGGLASLVAGAGVTKTGSTIDVIAGAAKGSGGPGGGLVVAADSIAVDFDKVVGKYSADIGDASSTSIVVTHNLNTRDCTVQVYDKTTPWSEVHPEVQRTSVNTVTLIFSVAPTAAQFRCVVHA